MRELDSPMARSASWMSGRRTATGWSLPSNQKPVYPVRASIHARREKVAGDGGVNQFLSSSHTTKLTPTMTINAAMAIIPFQQSRIRLRVVQATPAIVQTPMIITTINTAKPPQRQRENVDRPGFCVYPRDQTTSGGEMAGIFVKRDATGTHVRLQGCCGNLERDQRM